MSQREQIIAIEQRLEGLEVRVDSHEVQLSVLETWLLRGKTALAVIPAMASVLVFAHWFLNEDSVSSKPPPVVDAVCEECLVDPLNHEWYCSDCVVVESVDGEALCLSVPVHAGSNRNMPRASYGRLPHTRVVSRQMQATY